VDREPRRRPDHESPEEEGIPDTAGPAPGKPETGDPQEGLVPPRDEPTAVEDTGTTAEEQREGEPLDERLAEEQPEREPDDRRDAGGLIEDDAGLVDREKDEVAVEAERDTEGRSAEERAVRVEEEPEGLTGGPDRYTPEDQGSD
jgi:hypothetical protein